MAKGQLHCDIIIFCKTTSGRRPMPWLRELRLWQYFLHLGWLADAYNCEGVIIVLNWIPVSSNAIEQVQTMKCQTADQLQSLK